MEISLLLSAAQSVPCDGPTRVPQDSYCISTPIPRHGDSSTFVPKTFNQLLPSQLALSSVTTLPQLQSPTRPYSLRVEEGRIDKKAPKPFRCSIEGCEATFGQKGSLTRHIKSKHEKLRPHACNRCPKSFSALWTLRVHQRNVHLKSKPHKCHLCDKSFGELFNKSKHIAIVHEGKRPFSCPICSRAFGYKGDMRKHVSELHEQPGRPYQCMVPSCGVKFARKRYLRRHENLSHKGTTAIGCQGGSVTPISSPHAPCTYSSISLPPPLDKSQLEEKRSIHSMDPFDVRDLRPDEQVQGERVRELGRALNENWLLSRQRKKPNAWFRPCPQP